ncbi:BamA/TamA family outer membrane protein [Anaeromyxobacter oryzae]|nr:BamA/TamA family outer membrane protein [Anaeromyxobacter oryzae]
MRAHLLLVALLVATRGAPAARASDDGAAPGIDEGAAPIEGTTAAEPCTSSTSCAARLGHGNVCVAGRCTEYFDRRDAYGLLGLRTTAAPTPQRLVPFVAAVPAIGYSPSSGLLLGFAGTMGMLLGEPEDTTISNATGTLLYTTKNQLIVSVAATAMTAGNEWEILGDWRLLLFNQDTYGLGASSSPLATGVSINGWGDLAAIPGAQPMDFDLLRLHQSALRHVAGSIYLGVGYRFDRYYGIVDRRLDLSASPPVVTSHFAYSRVQGFDPGAYTLSGLSLEAMSESRDSTIAPYRGWYAHLRFTGHPTWLGSTQSSTMISADGRIYVGLSDEDPRNLLAFWVLGSGVTSGRVPYLALPASGWDPRSTSGRGYVQGRFRGTAMVYGEAEWRFRLTADGLLGGTVFASAQTFSRPAVKLPAYGYTEHGEDLFDTIRPAGGLGLRVMLLKQSRTALRVDIAGGERSIGFYLGAGEAF